MNVLSFPLSYLVYLWQSTWIKSLRNKGRERIGTKHWEFATLTSFGNRQLQEQCSIKSSRICSFKLWSVGAFSCQNMAFSAEASSKVFDSKSEPPPIFDGTTRLYISQMCPYAQRVWFARNYKGLDDIQLVNISLSDKPTWYTEKVYFVGKVPCLEHNGKVKGESLDLLEYLDQNFEGPRILPMDPEKKEVAAELIKYTDTFTKAGFSALSMKDDTPAAIEPVFGPVLDHLEEALGKFSDGGPFFLGELGVVDIAYAPFIERLQLSFSNIKSYDITKGRPNLARWIEAIDKVDAYAKTKVDPSTLLETYKRMLANDYFVKIGIASAKT